MSSQVIIQRKAGQEIPEDYLKLALAACPKGWGASAVQDGKLEVIHGEDLTIEDVRGTEANFGTFTLTLVGTDSALNLNDVPPFELVGNDNDEPLIAVHIAGEFPGFHKEKSSHPSIYHFADFISDKVQDLFDNVDKDLDKTMTKIAEERFKEKLKMNAVSLGFITFVAQNDKAVTIFQGDTAKEFPWGWVSNTFGYGEKPKEEPKTEEPKKKSLFQKSRSTVREKVDHQPSNNVVAAGADKPPPKETAVKAPEPEKPKPVPLTLQNITVKEFGIPGYLPRKLAKRYIKERIGHVPPNYQEEGAKFKMYVAPDGKAITLSELNKALGMSMSNLPKLENPKAPNQKDVEPKHIDSSKLASNPRPTFSASSRERFQRYFSDERVRKIIGENAELITDPDNVQGYEGKIAPAHHQLGMKTTEDLDALPFVEFEAIGRTDIHDLAVLAYHYKVRALQAEKRLSAVKPKKEEQTEVKAEEPKTEKRSLFSKNRAAA